MANGLDKLAQRSDGPKSKKAPKIAAQVTPAVQTAVDKIFTLKSQITELGTQLATNEDIVIQHVIPQQEAAAREGNFSKTFEVAGTTESISLTLADSFSVPQDDTAIDEIKSLLKKKFPDFIQKRRFASIKETVLKNEVMVNKIIAALEAAHLNVGDILEVVDKYVTQPDVDRKQFELTPKELEKFRTLVKQRKASLK